MAGRQDGAAALSSSGQAARSAQELAAQGAGLAAAGSFAAAAALFERSLLLDGSDAAAHEMLAQCRMEEGKDEAAFEAAAEAVRLRPDWPAALLTLGRAARNAGRLHEAAAAYQRHLQSTAAAEAAAAATVAEGVAAAEGEAAAEAAEEARQELEEVQDLLQLSLGHSIGLPGLRLLEQHGAAVGPGGVAWEAGALLAWFLVQQASGGHICGSDSCAAVAGTAAGTAACSAAAGGPAPTAAAAPAAGFLRGQRVLELGSGGTGLVGLAAACLGASVTATDLPEVLPLLRASVAANAGMVAAAGGAVVAAQLDWRQPDGALLAPPAGQPQHDWLLGADLVFRMSPVEPLVACMAAAERHAAAHGRRLKVLLCHKRRHEEVDAALLDGLRAAGVPLGAVLRDAGSRCTVYANEAAIAALGAAPLAAELE